MKFKSFFLGMMAGILLVPGLVVFAANSEYICTAVNYKIVINGAEYVNNELPILNYNGNTYAPLKSVLEASGLAVTWNDELKQAEVSKLSSQTTTVSDTSDQASARSKFTPDGLEAYRSEDNGIYYIPVSNFNIKYEPQGYRIRINALDSSKPVCLYGNGEIILQGVDKKESGGMEYDYYVNTILPLIQ